MVRAIALQSPKTAILLGPKLKSRSGHKKYDGEIVTKMQIYSRFSRSFTARGYLPRNPPGFKANKL